MSVKGSFQDISFVELLQMLHQSRKTGRIEVFQDKKWAMVILKEGVVWHVEPRGFPTNQPEEVIYSLVGMSEGTFVFQRIQVLPVLERSVNLSTESLIMEGTKRMDDDQVIATEIGNDQQSRNVLKFKPGAEAKVKYVPQTVKKVLQHIDGQRSMIDVINQSQIDASQAAQIIKELINHGVLETEEPKASGAAQPAPPTEADVAPPPAQ